MKKLLCNFKIKHTLILLVSLLLNSLLFAQNIGTNSEDIMRSNGKIYVVVAVCVTILIGLFLYVFLIDKKLSKIEKEAE